MAPMPELRQPMYVPAPEPSAAQGAPSRCGCPLEVDVMLVLAYRDHVILLQPGSSGTPASRWELPSGRVEVGEDALSAAIRLGDELVGVRFDRAELNLAGLVHCRYPQQVGRLGLFFSATYLPSRHASPRSMRPEAWTGIEWAPLTSLPDGLAAYHVAGLDLVRSGEAYGALGWAVP